MVVIKPCFVTVLEANLAKRSVAAHCCTLEGAMAAINAGVKTIEHAYHANDELFHAMKDFGCIIVPTLAFVEKLHKQRFPET